MQVILDETTVSDLFFNHENVETTNVYQGQEPPSQQEINEALMKDAKSFSELLGNQVSPEWLIEDYNKRL